MKVGPSVRGGAKGVNRLAAVWEKPLKTNITNVPLHLGWCRVTIGHKGWVFWGQGSRKDIPDAVSASLISSWRNILLEKHSSVNESNGKRRDICFC